MGSVSSHFVGAGGGLLMSVIAFSIVFLVILGLMLVMMALKHVAKAINPEGDSAPKSATAAAAKPAAVSAPQPEAANASVAAAVSPDDELVAVITAAISAATGTVSRVLSFAPAPEAAAARQTSAWKMTSILANSRVARD